MPSSGSVQSMTSINCLEIKSRRLMKNLNSGTAERKLDKPIEAMLRCGARPVNAIEKARAEEYCESLFARPSESAKIPEWMGLWVDGKADSNRLKMANTAIGLGSIIPSNRVTKSLFQAEGGRYGRGDGRTTGIYQDGSSVRRRIVGEPLYACTRCGGQRHWRGEK